MIRRIGGLSVIIPATDSPVTLDATIAAVERLRASERGDRGPHRAQKPGPSAARNEGARKATSDILVFISTQTLRYMPMR